MSTVEKYQNFKALTESAFFAEFSAFLAARADIHNQEAENLSESILTLLKREQHIGAACECRKIAEEFKTHIEQLLVKALNEETKHGQA